ncbi:hypothetical protein GCM10020229_79790 [Kitasatospora albolonga]
MGFGAGVGLADGVADALGLGPGLGVADALALAEGAAAATGFPSGFPTATVTAALVAVTATSPATARPTPSARGIRPPLLDVPTDPPSGPAASTEAVSGTGADAYSDADKALPRKNRTRGPCSSPKHALARDSTDYGSHSPHPPIRFPRRSVTMPTQPDTP